MKYYGLGLPSDVKREPHRCACGRELALMKTRDGYLLKGCPCGRKEWSITSGLWRGYDDQVLFLFPTDPAAPDPRD